MRNVFTLIFFMMGAVMLRAQEFKGGLILGANFCQIDGDNHSGYNKPGIHAGFMLNRPVSEKGSIQFEMLLSNKGSRINFKDSTGIGANAIVVYRLNYIEVPLLYRYQIKPKFYLEGGPSVGILYSGKRDVGVGFEKIEGLRKIDFLGNIGAGYKLADKLYASWRLQYSLTTIINITKPQNAEFLRTGVYNNVVSLSLQYFFN